MRVTKDVIKDTTRATTTHTNRDGMKSTGFCTWSKQLSYVHTYTVTQMLGSHTNTITGTIRHNHKHETHTHTWFLTVPSSSSHTDTHRQPQSQKHRVTLLATSSSRASPPSPQVPHTKPPSPARQTLQTDRAVPGPWGAAPWPSLNPGAWGARTEEGSSGLSAGRAPPRQLGSPRDKEGGPRDLCPGTLDQAFFFFLWGLPEIPIILFRLEGDGVPGTETLF